MLLFHGSNVAIEKIDLQKCRPNKDFGKGFYTTAIKEQAERMAFRTYNRFGGEKWITVFDFNELLTEESKILIKRFIEPNEEWVDFVLNNRYPKRNCENSSHNRDNKYQIVSGPVANDDIDLSLDLFDQGFIPKTVLVERLYHKKLKNQYSFHNEQVIQFLVKNEAYRV